VSDEIQLFRKFVGEMDTLLRGNEKINGLSQRELLNSLFKEEKKFKEIILDNNYGQHIYENFMIFILEDKGNKLSIRPYFRERQDTFSRRIFPILKKKDFTKLYRFRINYLFAKWTIENSKSDLRRKLMSTYNSMLRIRKLLCENNLPLAINRAKLFWSKTPKSYIEYMDLIQDSSKGLLEAIDNFVPPYRTVFRSVAISRMGLNMSEDYSSTLVKLPPKDKRILYRARKAKLKNTDISGKDLQSFVNESFSDTTSADIELIEAAANQLVNIDDRPAGGYSMAETLADPNSLEDNIEFSELSSKLDILLKKLMTIEAKIMLLKHGDLGSILKG
jgi:DNA-directed RNA polymerase specialized sigma subunit